MCAPLDSYFTEKESFGALILPEPKANDPVVSIETNRLKAQQRRLTNNKKKTIEKFIIFDPYLRAIPQYWTETYHSLSPPICFPISALNTA